MWKKIAILLSWVSALVKPKECRNTFYKEQASYDVNVFVSVTNVLIKKGYFHAWKQP